MKVGSLFSGIGGLDLGLEQAGMETVWQVEFDDWARQKLDENFPHTKKFKDVREVGKHNLERVDLIAGGFPCVDISIANLNGLGLDGEGSGLWSEMFRIICELRPRYTLIENVARLSVFGLDRVLSDLASVGLDAEWQTLRASTFGLPIQRKRLFILAYTRSVGLEAVAFKRDGLEGIFEQLWERTITVPIGGAEYTYPEIPEHLRLDDGLSDELSEIKTAIKGYGNAVCPPVAKWIGERILEFDLSIR